MEKNNFQPMPEQNISQANQQAVGSISQESPPTIQEKENKPWKILVYGLSTIAFIAFGVLGFWFYREKMVKKPASPALPTTTSTPIIPTPSPTPESTIPADWRAYRNEQFNFMINYPSDWSYYEANQGNSFANILYLRPVEPESPFKEQNLMIIQMGKTFEKNLDYNDFIKANCSKEECLTLKDAIDTTVGGLTGKKIKNFFGLASEHVFLINNQDTFIFSQSYLDKSYNEEYTDEEKKKIFFQILSTFKFLDSDTNRGIKQLITNKEALAEIDSDPYTIKDLRATNSILEIDVSYGGGCKQHDFDLYWNSRFLESLPPQVELFLIHTSNGDSCKALVSEQLQFDVSEIEYGFTMYETNKIIINLFDFNTKEHYSKKVNLSKE